MQRIDAHQHFWNYDPIRDIWITNSMQVIKRNFLPPDLKPLLEKNGIQGCVAVQAHQSESETDFLISLAQKFEFIKGIVGWVNLQADEIGIRLEHYKNLEIVKGFRHILQSETNRAFMLQPKFLNGIKRLQEFNFTYDILI